MGLEELKWQRNSSLKEMMDRYNALVDGMAQLSQDLTELTQTMAGEYAVIEDRFHELNDKILTVNYKTDEMQQDIAGKLDDILRRISLNHPGS